MTLSHSHLAAPFRRGKPVAVNSTQYQGHAKVAATKVRIRADLDIGVAFLQLREVVANDAFGERLGILHWQPEVGFEISIGGLLGQSRLLRSASAPRFTAVFSHSSSMVPIAKDDIA